MSVLERQPPKVLLKLSQLLMGLELPYSNPFDDDYDNLKLLNSTASWIGEKLNIEDLEFISAFIVKNEDLIQKLDRKEITYKEAIQEIVIPQKKSYKLNYEIWGPATLTEQYHTEWESYFKEWVKDSLRYSYNEGHFDYYQGTYDGYETDNFEPDNFEIYNVDEVIENKEKLLDKLVLENTSELLQSLDKNTLIQLRNLINQKLSS